MDENEPRNGLREQVRQLDVEVASLRETRHEHADRLGRIEGWIETSTPISERQALDLETLKLRDQETKVTQRLTVAVGGLLGTFLISLVIFAATRT